MRSVLLLRKSRFHRFSTQADRFTQAVNAVPLLKEEPSNEVKLKMYALFSQAKKGECTTPAPGFFDIVGSAKHKAWKSLGSMKKEEAMDEYVSVVSQLFGGQLPSSAGATAPSATDVNSSNSTTVPATSAPAFTLESIAFPRRVSTAGASTHNLSTVNISFSDNGVATVQLNRPATLNAFNVPMWNDLKESFQVVARREGARVAILTGSPKSFTAGMDLRVFADMQQTLSKEKCEGRQREAVVRVIEYLQACISAPEQCPVPVIAAVSGHCIGAGVDLITACDLRYCTADSSFSVKETDLAMVADVGTLQRLPKLIGHQRALELTYTARTFKGKEAEDMGLVLKCFDTYDEMMTHVHSVADVIAAKSPLTIRGIKQTVLHTRDHSVEDSLKQIQLWNAAHLYSGDLVEAMRAGMSKEKPNFKN